MSRNLLPRRLLCAAILAAIGIHPAHAAKSAKTTATLKDRPLACRAVLADPVPESLLTSEETDDGRVHVYADRGEFLLNQSATFRGAVELRFGDLHLFADEVTHDQTRNSLNAIGNIHLSKEGGETIITPRLHYQLDTESGDAEEARFSFAEGIGRGTARLLHFEGRDALQFEDVRYTTCPPQQDDWTLRASRLTLDKVSETGSARNVTISFMHVPIFYSPYLSFPLTEERKTGFLNPRIGHSSHSGAFVSVPYYFNLAPQYDDTLTTRYLSKRGVQLQNEFRYLGAAYNGKLQLEYLPNDNDANRDRGATFFQHNQALSPLWTFSTDLQWVSDNSYLIDLSDNPADAGKTHLPRTLRFDYGGSIWRFSARTSTYQTLDTTIPLTEQPYQRLPQLLLTVNYPAGPNQLHPSLDAEWVNFYRQDSVNGQRVDLFPNISLPLRTSYVYFTPKVGYRYTSWSLDNTSGDNSPERGLPVYSIDTGLAFERDDRWGDTALTQTLEPRLYYLRIPYKNQDNLPVFDAAIPDFSFFNFFRENRFVGADRIGDANQMTAAITTRYLSSENGIEQARISFGQVQYFEDQRVNLPAGTVTQTRSDLIAETYARLGAPWHVRGALQWNTRERDTQKGSLYLYYRPDNKHVINAGYRYVNSVEELIDISTQWPLAAHWVGALRWNYSVPESRLVQGYAGIEYTSCCWAFRAVVRQRVLPDGTEDKGVLFELELTGLAKLGQTEENPFKQSRFLYE